MITSTIITARYRGLILEAVGIHGCKYVKTFVYADGKQRYSGCSSIKHADEFFANTDDVQKMVVYKYHPKKKNFEVFKYYER